MRNIFTVLAGWRSRCAEYFPYSTYFEGSKSSAVMNSPSQQIEGTPQNEGAGKDSLSMNGKLEEGFKALVV